MPHPAAPPSYEGRALAHPDEELTDQGLSFDVVTLLSRRNLLRVVGLGAAAAGLAACGRPTMAVTTSAGEIPDETAGPYPGDGSNGPDALELSGIVRRDIRTSIGSASATAGGVDMELELTITDTANGGAPFAGVAVYVWHCTRDGGYSMYSDGIKDENYLRGVQVTNAKGVVEFTSIFPGCYRGRWPHIHFEVYPDQASITDSTRAIATSQLALPQDVCEAVYSQSGYSASVGNLADVTLADDTEFGNDDGIAQLASVTGDVSLGYVAALTVAVDTATAPAEDKGFGRRGNG